MFLKIGISLFCILIPIIYCHENDVHTIQYTEQNFNEEVAKKNHFIMFYAPWCGHCQRLAPIWEQLAEMLNVEEDGRVRIAKVDCTTDNTLCSEHFVTGYPTLKFFKSGEKSGVKFRGTRDLPTLSSFINEQLSNTNNDAAPITPEVGNGPKELTEENFYDTVKDGSHFVKFYAPWCGHCQKLAPTWDELAKSYQNDNTVGISKIDCTNYRKICGEFEVKGYPTLLWIENGKRIDKYSGSRTYEDLKAYITEKTITETMRKNEEPEKDVKEEANEIVESVLTLTSDTFDEGISKGISFVKFFAPWCGHCKRLASTWSELGKMFSAEDNVKIIKIDCTNDENKKLCNEQVLEGFPTLLLYDNGKKISEYNGSRGLDDLYEFIMNHKNKKHDEL